MEKKVTQEKESKEPYKYKEESNREFSLVEREESGNKIEIIEDVAGEVIRSN